MRLARKLFLLTAMAITAIAITAGTANAQEESVEVTNEAEHCNLGAANCVVHVVGSATLLLHQFGTEIPFSACNDEFVATLDEDGEGAVTSYTNNASETGPCTRVMCDDEGETPWPISNTGEYTGSQTEEGHLTVRFCLDTVHQEELDGTHCDAEIQLHNHGNHKYGFEAEAVECPIIGMDVWVELNGQWESEADPGAGETDIEIIH